MRSDGVPVSASRVIGPGWRDDVRVRRLPDDHLMLIWRGPPRIVLGIFPDRQAIERYVERETGKHEDARR